MLRGYSNPLNAIWQRLSLFRTSDSSVVRYRLRIGPVLYGDSGPHDVQVINEIWLYRTYGLDPSFVPRRDWTVVDIGAHKGFFSVWAGLQMLGGNLLAFEPDPHNFGQLVRNVSQLPSDIKVTSKRRAVSAAGGTRLLHRIPTLSGKHSLYEERSAERAKAAAVSTGRSIPVQTYSLEEALAGCTSVDLLKLDVEGSEYELLLESPDPVFRKVHRIVLEYDPSHPLDPDTKWTVLFARLEALGFQVQKSEKWPLLFAARPGPQSNANDFADTR
jgi:FkbM family methyltransferase